MDSREVEKMIDAKLRVLEEKLMRYIDARLAEKYKQQCTSLVAAEDKFRKEARQDLVTYVNQKVTPQILELNKTIQYMRMEQDGQELTTEYRRRVLDICDGDMKAIADSGDSKTAFQHKMFVFRDDDVAP